MLADRYVAMVDILGFKNMIERQSLPKVVEMVHSLLKRVRSIEQPYWTYVNDRKVTYSGIYAPDMSHFSDTIVFWTPPFNGTDPRENIILASFLMCINSIIFHGFNSGIPLRAGIGFGETYIDQKENIILGQAIVDAYLTESVQDWIGGAFNPTCPFEALINRPDGIAIEYQIPVKKEQPLVLDKALNWIQPAVDGMQRFMKIELGYSYREILEAAFESYLNQDLDPSIRTKYLNTKVFYDLQMNRRPRRDLLRQHLD